VPTLTAEQEKQLVFFAPKPYYPRHARQEYKTGAGVFLLNVNPETGLVASIRIEKTTGLWSFDVSCLKTFIKWRFSPTRSRKYVITNRFARQKLKLSRANRTPLKLFAHVLRAPSGSLHAAGRKPHVAFEVLGPAVEFLVLPSETYAATGSRVLRKTLQSGSTYWHDAIHNLYRV